jgi:iron complex outermembrane receptor protein
LVPGVFTNLFLSGAARVAAAAMLFMGSAPALLIAQQTTRDSMRATPTTIEAARVEIARDRDRSVLSLPFAVSRVSADSLRPAVRRAAVGDLLFAVPGVQVQPRNNPTQDARIAVRGFGARAAFGVRGVKVLRDGIPISLPDGQTPMDWLDLETIERVEAIRGTASALYGNAAGGVLDFRSEAAAASAFAGRTRVWDGGGARRANVLLSGTPSSRGATPPSWLASVTRTISDGPRIYARQEATSGFARVEGALGGTTVRVIGSAFDMPVAENPGALTLAELERDVRLPDSLNITRGASKAVQHAQLGVVAERGSADDGLAAAAWIGTRDLDNPLPFAVVAVDRRNAGAWVRGTTSHRLAGLPVRVSAGLDLQSVNDDRRNFANCVGQATSATCPTAGAARGVLRLDQTEVVQSEGAFVRYEVAVPRRLDLSAALRWDQVRFRLTDRFLSDTRDDSGEQAQTALNPMIGLVWRARPTWSIYATVNTAFETPTVTELTTQADGTAGLNGALSPQRTRTAEAGVRGLLGTSTWIELAAFDARSRDELVPFDVPNQPGRRAFRNAGRTTRRGVELLVRSQRTLGAQLTADVGVAASAGRFRFDEYTVGTTSFAGNIVPGSPARQGQAWATVRRAAWFATVDVSAASQIVVDDAGTTSAPGWRAVNLRVGSEGIAVRDGWRVAPVLGVENVLDARYASAVLVNATRGRFFEPAPPRTAFAGLRVERQ